MLPSVLLSLLRVILPYNSTYDELYSTEANVMLKLIKKHGYPAEHHQIETEDSYISSVFRIPGSPASPQAPNKPVVFLQHALLLSSADYVVTGPGKALALVLADAGYDVWLGNARGNRFSRGHKTLTTKSAAYWNFSWHEMGEFDVPAAIDYILTLTNQTAIHYIGHSEGTTVFFVMASTRPEYNAKIKTMHAMAPVTTLQHSTSPLMRIYRFTNANRDKMTKTGIFELFPYNREFGRTFSVFCRNGHEFQGVCAEFFHIISGGNSGQVNNSLLADIMSQLPAGASTGRLAHLGQGVDTGKFRRFDHGKEKNLLLYGSATPPNYELDKITAPLFLQYAEVDALDDIKDVMALNSKLKSVVELRPVPNPKWTHMDFLYGQDAKSLVYDHIIEKMAAYD